MSTPENQVGVISTEPVGATIQPQYTTRAVKTYPLTASELDSVSSLSTRATIYISLAIGLISLAMGIWVSAAFVTDKGLPPEGAVLCHFGAPVLVVIGAVFVVLAAIEFRYKTNMLREIRNDKSGTN